MEQDFFIHFGNIMKVFYKVPAISESWNSAIYGFKWDFDNVRDLKKLLLRWKEEVEDETGFKYSYYRFLLLNNKS